MKAYENAAEAKRGIGDYFQFYNEERPHYALERFTPDEAYAGVPTQLEAA